MLHAISTSSQYQCRSLGFALSKGGCSVDPHVDIFFRRISMLRRIIVKHPHCLTTIRDVAKFSRAKGVPGTYQVGDDISQFTPAPPPGSPDRYQWKARQRQRGPVGLLMEHTHMLAAAIDFNSLAVVRSQRADLPIVDTPLQLLKPTMVRMAFDALQRVASTTRAMLANAVDVDPSLFHKATAELSKKD